MSSKPRLRKDTITLYDSNKALSDEWHPTRNSFSPKEVAYKSHLIVWWLGKCGHEWEAQIKSRTMGNGCSVCYGRTVLIGFNDLKTNHPELSKEWHPTKNSKLTPYDFSKTSGKIVWWLGKCGHEWESAINNRSSGKNGCPYCAGQKVLVGFNDFETCNPDSAKYWHPTKNGSKLPSEFTHASGIRVWWLGDCGHEWETSISNSKIIHCSICMPKGFNSSKPATFYIIKHLGHQSWKVGITNQDSNRLGKFKELGWTESELYHSIDGKLVQSIESKMLNWIRKDLKLDYGMLKEDMPSIGGWSETFPYWDIDIFKLRAKLEEVIKLLNA